jgi:hypothetical protein
VTDIAINISPRRIADLMVTAIEGNHMTRAWCHGIYWQTKQSRPPRNPNGGPWYDNPAVFAEPFQIEVYEIVDETRAPAGDNLKLHVCTQDTFREGLAIMADKYPAHFGDILSENEDAVTADVFLQCVALKEIVYG